MRHRHRSPILSIIQLAIFGFIFWQVSQGIAADPSGSPATAFDNTFRTIRLVIFGVVAMAALNVLYPLAAWGVGKLRERQETWTPEERFVVSDDGEKAPARRPRNCPGCGASLFADAPACPWCGHALGDPSPLA